MVGMQLDMEAVNRLAAAGTLAHIPPMMVAALEQSGEEGCQEVEDFVVEVRAAQCSGAHQA